MNFFQKISELNLTGTLKITIQSVGEKVVVSLLLDNDQCGDAARKVIPPLILTGTPAEVDGGFFETITTPLEKTSGLMVNMEAFLKQVEVATQESAMKKAQVDKEAKEKTEKTKSYNAAMEKVTELEKEKKYREAFGKLPNPGDHPDHAEAIEEKRKALTAQFSQIELFV